MKSVEYKVAKISDYFVYNPSKTAQKMFLYPLVCGLFTYEPGYKLMRSSYDSFLLMYIQNGTMILNCGDKPQTVGKNSFVLLDCYKPHGYSTETGYECLWLHFDGVLARDYYEAIVSQLGNVFSMQDPFAVCRKLSAILKIFLDNKTVREPLLSKYITDILTELLLFNPDKSLGKGYADMAEQVITYINEHSSEDISVERLAEMSGLSPYYFIRVFKKETGYTPHEYLINRRMASARYLLKCTALSIKEICFNTGFSSESVFCNAFKKQHNMTPQAYRESGSLGEKISL